MLRFRSLCVLLPGLMLACSDGDSTEGVTPTLPLVITAADPAVGPQSGGTSVELSGEGFTPSTELRFGAVFAPSVEWIDDTRLLVMTPPSLVDGPVDIVATDGERRGRLDEAFTYEPPPFIERLSPESGPELGDTEVVIVGGPFFEGVRVFFDDVPADDVGVIDETVINARTPAGELGWVSVRVENPDGQSDTLRNAFQYTRPTDLLCQVILTIPGFQARDFPTDAPFTIRWNAAVDPDSLAERVQLRVTGGESIDVAIELDGPRSARVTPARTLRFGTTYTLEVRAGVFTPDGQPCSGAAVAFVTSVPELSPRELRPAPVADLALYRDHLVVVSRNYRGLQIYDANDPGQLTLVADLVTEAQPEALALFGDRAYVSAGVGGLLVLDVAEPGAPRVLGRGGTPGFARAADVFEREGRFYAAVADGPGGLRLLDVTDPDDVNELSNIMPFGEDDALLDVAVSGNLVAAVADNAGFAVIDVSDLRSPQLRSIVTEARNALGLAFEGESVFVTRNCFGVDNWSVADPDAPVRVDRAEGENTCGNDRPDFLTDLAVSDGELLIANAPHGVLRIAAAEDGDLTRIEQVIAPGRATSVVANGNFVYAGTDAGPVVYERGDEGWTQTWFDPGGHGDAIDVSISESHLWMAASARGVQTFDLTDPLRPQLVDRDDTPATLAGRIAASSSVVTGQRLVIGDGREGISFFDLATPEDPARDGGLDDGLVQIDRIRAVEAHGDLVFACNDNRSVLFILAQDPANPELLFDAPMPGDPRGQCLDLLYVEDFASGPLLYVASNRGLDVYDATDPAAPELLTRTGTPASDSLAGMARAGNVLYVAGSTPDFEGVAGRRAQLHVFDLSEPRRPDYVGASEDLAEARDVIVLGSRAWVASGRHGIVAFDITEPLAPDLEMRVAVPGVATELAGQGRVLYVAQSDGGLQAVRLGAATTSP